MKGSVRKRGNKWYYSFEAASIDGKRKRVERVGGSTKKEAESALAKAVIEYENAGQIFTPTEISVADFMDLWMEKFVQANHRPTTITGYKQVIKNHIKPKLGHYKLKSISKQVINDFIFGIYNSGYTKRMLVYIKTVLSGALNYAFENDFIATNPMIGIKLPSYKNGGKKGRQREAITIDTFKTLIDRFPEGSNFHLALMIGFYTGLRISECYALAWDDIDLENNTITVNKQLLKDEENKVWNFREPKTDTSYRTVSIGTNLAALLKRECVKQKENELKYGEHYHIQYEKKSKIGIREVRIINQYKKDVGNVGKRIRFVNIKENGELLTTESFKYASRIFKHEMHIENFDFHTLRHTHTTILIENGANVKEVSERLGHKDINTTLKIYQSVTAKMKQQSVDIFDKVVNK